jgi:hypothetical protein
VKSLWGVIGLCLLSVPASASTIIFDTTSGYAGSPYYTSISNYQVTSPFNSNYQQWAGFKFNSGAYTAITDFSVALSNRAFPNANSTESLGATVTFELIALDPGALTNGAVVAASGLNPGTALYSAPGISTPNDTPTLVTVSGLNWAISANTNYALVAVGGSGASYGLVQTAFPQNAYASVSGNSIVPVPAALWLFGSALGLMGVVRRKINS